MYSSGLKPAKVIAQRESPSALTDAAHRFRGVRDLARAAEEALAAGAAEGKALARHDHGIVAVGGEEGQQAAARAAREAARRLALQQRDPLFYLSALEPPQRSSSSSTTVLPSTVRIAASIRSALDVKAELPAGSLPLLAFDEWSEESPEAAERAKRIDVAAKGRALRAVAALLRAQDKLQTDMNVSMVRSMCIHTPLLMWIWTVNQNRRCC